MTPTLARMLAARGRGLKKPIRWFSIPQLFRYERPQRGRLREHFQLNCDLIGEPGPLGDAEIIALAVDVMRAFGLTEQDVRVRLSDRRVLIALLDTSGIPAGGHATAFALLDKAGRGEYPAARTRALEAGLTADQVALLEGLGHLRSLDALAASHPGAAAAAGPLGAILDALGHMGLAGFVELDFTIVRGLAYYTGPVFELFDAGRTRRAICGGGRYDTLLAAMGGEDLPALGFGMGDVVLTSLLEERGLLPGHTPGLDVFVAPVGEADLPVALALVHELRDAGLRVEFPLGGAVLAKQLKLANARGARYALVIGPDDRSRGDAVLRDLRDGSQEPVSLATAGRRLAALTTGGADASPEPTSPR